MFKANWKKALLLVSAIVLVIPLILGCASTAVEEKPTIKIADTQFESLWIINAITEFIITEGYEYPVEIPQMTTPIAQVSLAKGDVDIWVEMWEQNWTDNYNEETAKGNIINGGMIYEGGPQFFVIPTWVHEEYNIDTVEDMKDNWELFIDPEDKSKGAFLNCIIGWQCEAINVVKLEAYGLDEYYNLIAPGSSGALEAALAGPQKTKEPVFGYYWAPTALMGMYDWYILEEPDYDADVWAKIIAAKDDESLRPLSEACAYETLPTNKGYHKTFGDKAPDLKAMMDKMVIGLEPLNRTAAWSKENEIQDYGEAAVWYLNEYESKWKSWVTTDAYNKIKAALADM
ncbi:glycine betaine ABC transporter substrate-binding protein [Chloroflexota bacterium]